MIVALLYQDPGIVSVLVFSAFFLILIFIVFLLASNICCGVDGQASMDVTLGIPSEN